MSVSRLSSAIASRSLLSTRAMRQQRRAWGKQEAHSLAGRQDGSKDGEVYWEVATMKSIRSLVGLPYEQFGPPLLRLSLIDRGRLGSPEAYALMDVDEALCDTRLHKRYKEAKPLVEGCRVQRWTSPGNDSFRPFGIVSMIVHSEEERGEVMVVFGDGDKAAERVPVRDVTTGLPLVRIPLGCSLKELTRAVEWCWADGHAGGSVRFHLNGVAVDGGSDASSANLVQAASAQAVAEARERGDQYVETAVDIEVGGVKTRVFAHSNDVTVPGSGWFSAIRGWFS